MRKNITFTMLFWALLALVISPVLSAAAPELSLAEALALGLEANFGIKKAWLTWENAKLNYERGKAAVCWPVPATPSCNRN